MLQLFKNASKQFYLLLALSLSLSLVNAQLARLSQRPPSTGLGGWSTNNFTICGAQNRDLRIEYNFCNLTPDGPCDIASACGSNPYKIHYRLLRNGHQIAKNTYQFSEAWGNWALYNFAVEPGEYEVEITLELRSGPIWPICSWNTHQETFTNKITVTRQQAQPNFRINNASIPANGSPISVCGSNIRLHAATTTCETRYLVSIQECDRWWNRTLQYEVNVWFAGQAPNNINLQQLAINYSQPPAFTGPINRRNTTLIGGNLPNGQKRYYRISVCVDEPFWVCKTALIEVDGNCRTTGDPDENIYDMIGTGGDNNENPDNQYDIILNGYGDNINSDMEKMPCSDEIYPGADPVDGGDARNGQALPKADKVEIESGTTPKLSPNPTNGQVNLALSLKLETQVIVNIFDAAGNRIKQGLINRKLMPGQQSLPLDINGLKSGIYIVEVLQGKQISKQKLVINQ